MIVPIEVSFFYICVDSIYIYIYSIYKSFNVKKLFFLPYTLNLVLCFKSLLGFMVNLFLILFFCNIINYGTQSLLLHFELIIFRFSGIKVIKYEDMKS